MKKYQRCLKSTSTELFGKISLFAQHPPLVFSSCRFPKFAKRLSTLSIQWSGRYSKEEYRSLAQTISENDTPGIVTLDAFTCAAHAGSLSVRGAGGDNRNRGAERNTQFARDGSSGAERCEVEEFQVDQAGDDGGLVASGESLRGTKPGTGGESTTYHREVVEATLKRAASEAR